MENNKIEPATSQTLTEPCEAPTLPPDGAEDDDKRNAPRVAPQKDGAALARLGKQELELP